MINPNAENEKIAREFVNEAFRLMGNNFSWKYNVVTRHFEIDTENFYILRFGDGSWIGNDKTRQMPLATANSLEKLLVLLNDQNPISNLEEPTPTPDEMVADAIGGFLDELDELERDANVKTIADLTAKVEQLEARIQQLEKAAPKPPTYQSKPSAMDGLMWAREPDHDSPTNIIWNFGDEWVAVTRPTPGTYFLTSSVDDCDPLPMVGTVFSIVQNAERACIAAQAKVAP